MPVREVVAFTALVWTVKSLRQPGLAQRYKPNFWFRSSFRTGGSGKPCDGLKLLSRVELSIEDIAEALMEIGCVSADFLVNSA